jgi:hypothetical protein
VLQLGRISSKVRKLPTESILVLTITIRKVP